MYIPIANMEPSGVQDLGRAKAFYDREFAGISYTPVEMHAAGLPELERFVREHGLIEGGRCIEIGCGRGAYQELVRDYVGTDISDTAGTNIRKTFRQCSATDLPFPDSAFDGAWTIWVIEHVPSPEKAMEEMRRVLRPGGVLFFAPAWQCRPWAADGYPSAPVQRLPVWEESIYKALIPLRDSVAWRSLFIFPRRACSDCWPGSSSVPRSSSGAERSRPNYDKFWMADSDAVNSMDPYEAILWSGFKSRGDEVLFPPSPVRQFLVRNGHIIVRVRK